MGTALDDTPRRHHQNLIGVHHRGQAVGNDQGGAPHLYAVQFRLNRFFGF